ncbi:MAG: hypothetical protein FJX71_01455 [Alphaproteobacteria bacterium]|nr:hypothetical protein [Alphaproteobacteria bacterium]
MNKFFISKVVSLLFVSLCVGAVNAAEQPKDKEEATPGTTTATAQPADPTRPKEEKTLQGDKVEPWGLEGGKFVDAPADLAHKIGEKIERNINKVFGKKEDE